MEGQAGSPLNGLEGSQALQQEGPPSEAVVFLDTAYTPGQQARPDMSNGKTVEALVDTGAAISSIDEELANVLNLPYTGSIRIGGVSGAEVRDLRLVQVYLPAFEKVCYEALAAVKLTEGGQRHEVLLGREFLKGYRMIYDGRSGVVVFEDQSSPW